MFGRRKSKQPQLPIILGFCDALVARNRCFRLYLQFLCLLPLLSWSYLLLQLMDAVQIFLRFGQNFCSQNRKKKHRGHGLLACTRRQPPRGDLDNEVRSLNVLFVLLTGAVLVQRGFLLQRICRQHKY